MCMEYTMRMAVSLLIRVQKFKKKMKKGEKRGEGRGRMGGGGFKFSPPTIYVMIIGYKHSDKV